MKKDKRFLVAIVDDNDLYSTMIKYVLSTDKDVDIMTFDTAEEFMKCFSFRPNLIVLDHYLKGINGLSALKPLKELHKNVPIIVMSSQRDIDVVIDYMNNGASDYIVKNDEGLELLKKEVEAIKNSEPYLEKNILNQIYRYFIPA